MSITKIRALHQEVFQISNDHEFNDLALRIFYVHLILNPVYKQFIQFLDPVLPEHYTEIPCLPISAFKYHKVMLEDMEVEKTFMSSGTTGQTRSKHHLADISIYEQSFMQGFERVYGPVSDLCILALLPNYIEQGDSSLVYMVHELIDRSGHPQSEFILDDHAKLRKTLQDLHAKGQRTLLIGTTYALLDLVEGHPLSFPDLIVMETGGMKGRRKELIREEVHLRLQAGFGVKYIHSEYGMTELCSQAYARRDGRFESPSWMKVLVRNTTDPRERMGDGRTGGVDILDLANIYSCPFIASDDLGRLHRDESFEILGRFDHSDIRGCSLLI
ncbi:MAG: acyl transferase [Flavobacteriales bacterium]|nr:acyl transferase [Flavobacteriales bacterium]